MMMQYEVLDNKKFPNDQPFDFNKANICYVHPHRFHQLKITQFGYRQLKSSKSDHVVIILPHEAIPQSIIGIPLELKATLKLYQKETIKIERVPLKIDSFLFPGLPSYKVADRIQFIPIQNEATTLLENNLINKLIKEPFYFSLGQQFILPIHKISENIVKQLNPQTKKRWRNFIKKKQVYLGRLFVEGVRYTQNNVMYYQMWEGTSKYFIFDPARTGVIFQKSRVLNRPNIVLSQLSPQIQKIYQLQPYTLLKSQFDKVAQSSNPIVILERRKHFGLKEYLKHISEFNKAYFFSLDCQKQYNLAGITNFINQSYTKAPGMIYLQNIQWIYSLVSGNLQPKRNSFKFVQKLISSFKQNLLKKGNDFPLLLVMSYSQNPFDINEIQTHHYKFQVDKKDVEHMNQILIDYQKNNFTKQEMQRVKEVSKTIGWELLYSILNKKHTAPQIIKNIEAIVKTEKVAQIPKVNWDDIGGLEATKDQIIQTILFPKMYPEIFDQLIKPRSGLLFYGPPGTGKTLLAKCIANECKMNFISVKGPEMLNMYIGQSEKNVRQTFERAFQSKPCIIFFDQLDALIPKRGKSNDSGQVMDRIVAELLSQMDNAWRVGDIFVIGATNRPDLLDPSIMRPGRFDKQIYLGICYQKQERMNILKAQTKKLKLGQDVDLQKIVDELPINFTGADFYGLTSKALVIAINKLVQRVDSTFNAKEIDWNSHLKRFQGEGVVIEQEDLLQALKDVKPSVSLQELKKFQELKSRYS